MGKTSSNHRKAIRDHLDLLYQDLSTKLEEVKTPFEKEIIQTALVTIINDKFLLETNEQEEFKLMIKYRIPTS